MLGEFLGIWNGWTPTCKHPPNAFSKTLEMFEKLHKIQWPCGAWLNFKRNLKAIFMPWSGFLKLPLPLSAAPVPTLRVEMQENLLLAPGKSKTNPSTGSFFLCVFILYIYYFLIFIFYWTIIASSNLFKYKNMNCAFYNNNRENSIWLKVIPDLC